MNHTIAAVDPIQCMLKLHFSALDRLKWPQDYAKHRNEQRILVFITTSAAHTLSFTCAVEEASYKLVWKYVIRSLHAICNTRKP